MTESRLWFLGAPADPEMVAIEGLLRKCGERVAYALDERGERVTPATAYRCPVPAPEGVTVYAVECFDTLPDGWVRIDHHRPGDPGYGRPPSEFLAASSLGQVIAELARLGCLPGPLVGSYEWVGDWEEEKRAAFRWFHWETEARTAFSGGALFERFRTPYRISPCDGYYILARRVSGVVEFAASPDEMRGEGAVRVAPDKIVRVHIPHDLVLAAAADHCLGAAYRGECPGVDPDDLMRWRAENRAKFQGRTVEEVLEDVERAREALSRAPELLLAPLYSPRCTCGGVGDCGCCTGHPDYVGGDLTVCDMRHAYTVRTVLVEPFVDGATVDAAGVGDSVTIEFGAREEGAWDEGSHHTFVRRGVPELPDAASREGVAYLAYVDRDGSGCPCRPKIVLGGCTTPDMVRAFLDHWAPSQGLVDAYGDPERGFAGAYYPTEVAS